MCCCCLNSLYEVGGSPAGRAVVVGAAVVGVVDGAAVVDVDVLVVVGATSSEAHPAATIEIATTSVMMVLFGMA